MPPPDLAPDFERRARDSFAAQTVMATMGVTVERAAPGEVVLAMRHRADLTQQHGFLHAGVVSTALDSACGYAAFTLMPPGAAVLTIEFKVNLLAPARGPWYRFTGRVTKAGRTISVVDGRATQRATPEAGDEALIATMTATVMTVMGRGIQG
jgi:uncharacterized protein (TIGR00369 family)